MTYFFSKPLQANYAAVLVHKLMNKDLPPHAKQEVSAQQKQPLQLLHYQLCHPISNRCLCLTCSFKKILNNIA